MTTAPSAYRVEQAMAAAQAFRHQLAQDGELAADEATLKNALDAETDVRALMVRLARFVIDAESMGKAAAERISAINARKQRFGRRADNARGTLLAMMEALGEKTLPDAEFTVTVKAGGKSVYITDETALPEAYVRTTRTPDKAAIKAALAVGDVPGAYLGNNPPTIQIKAT